MRGTVSWSRSACIALAVGLGVTLAPTASAAIPYDDQTTPGVLRGIAYDPGDPWAMGYWEYLPSNFDTVPATHRYPLLVSLGGIGSFDNPSNCPGDADICAVQGCNGDGLCRAFRRGPPVEINAGVWDEVARPFITVTPQNLATTSSTAEFDPDDVDALIAFVIANYPVDPRRVYMLGNSQGGRGVLQYVGAYPRRLAAATVGPGGGVAPGTVCNFQDTALWALHGEDDADQNLGVGVFDPCVMVEYVQQYNEPNLFPQIPECVARVGTPYPTARMTMFFGVAHGAWTPAFEDVASGFAGAEWTTDEACNIGIAFREYAANLDPDGVYSWMLTFDRPDTTAPDDFDVQDDAPSFDLTATTEDDDAITYTWTQTAGNAVVLGNADQETATVTGFALGESYTFEVFAVDADNQWDRDDVVVTIIEEPIGGSTGGSSGGSSGGPATTGDPTSTSGGGSGGTSGTSSATTAATTSAGSGATATSTTGSGTSTGSTGVATDGGTGGSASNNDGSDAGCGCAARGDRSTPAFWLALFAIAVRRRRKGGK